MQDIAYYNGIFAPIQDMRLPLNDRGNYFGDGVYEVLYARNHRFFAEEEHMARLMNSLRLSEIKLPMPVADITAVLREMVRRVDAVEQLVYFQITRGTYPRGHIYPPEGIPSNLLAFTRPCGLEDVSRPVKLCTHPDLRWNHCDIKSLNLLPNVMAAQRAQEQGCTEAVLHKDGMVTECSSSSVLILRQGTLRTAPCGPGILPGITRGHMLLLAGELGIPVREQSFTLDELLAADEILVTSTTTHGQYANEIDSKPVGGRAPALVRALQKAYAAKVETAVGAV